MTSSIPSKTSKNTNKSSGRGRGRGKGSSRPRGFWPLVGNKLERCPNQCRSRYNWLNKVDQPLFMIEEEEED